MTDENVYKSQQQVKVLFENLLEKHGDSLKALAYGSPESQQRRFKILYEVGDMEGCSVLDVGCGFGDFHDYLSKRLRGFSYHGIDISEKIIAVAREKYPGASFEVGDMLRIEGRTYDYVIGSGFNCFNTGRNDEVIREALTRMFNVCARGIAVQMISAYAPRKDDVSYYATPEMVYRHAMGLTRRVILRHDYAPNDFTIYLYRQ